MDEKSTRMLFATVALSALAVLFAVPAHAYIAQGDGVTAARSQQQAQSAAPGTIPYLSQGIGVDKSLFDGRSGPQVTGRQQVAQQSVGLDPAIATAIEARSGLTGVHAALQSRSETPAATQLPHGIQVVLSPPSEEPQSVGLTGDSGLTRSVPNPAPQSLGLTGDSALTRSVPNSEPQGLTGDSAATRYLQPVSTPSTPTVSSGDDFDWTSFGAGAGMVALVAAGFGGILLTMRRRHSVGLP
jgi:hypothetical protein